MADMSGDAVITTDLVGLQNVASYTTDLLFSSSCPSGIEFPAIVGGIPFTLSLGGTIQIALSMALANSSSSRARRLTSASAAPAGFHFKACGGLSLYGSEERTHRSPKSILDLLSGIHPGPVGIVVYRPVAQGRAFGFGSPPDRRRRVHL